MSLRADNAALDEYYALKMQNNHRDQLVYHCRRPVYILLNTLFIVAFPVPLSFSERGPSQHQKCIKLEARGKRAVHDF